MIFWNSLTGGRRAVVSFAGFSKLKIILP